MFPPTYVHVATNCHVMECSIANSCYIHISGVKLTLPNGESLLCRMALICTTVDLPARAIVANIVQFNGYWGCCHCLQKGKSLQVFTE